MRGKVYQNILRTSEFSVEWKFNNSGFSGISTRKFVPFVPVSKILEFLVELKRPKCDLERCKIKMNVFFSFCSA